MARSTRTARRYAEAAFELAARDKSHERWSEDLRLAADVVQDDRVASIASNPAVPFAEREELLRRLLGDRLAKPAFNLVVLLAQRGRLDLLPGVAREFGRMLDELQGIQPATVTSATELKPADADAVRERLEQMTGHTVRLTNEVDPDLIGGLTVRIGDKLIDGSVRGRLERLRDQLVAGSR